MGEEVLQGGRFGVPPPRAPWDRHAEERGATRLIADLVADQSTRLVFWCDGEVYVTAGVSGPVLARVPPGTVGAGPNRRDDDMDADRHGDLIVFLGRMGSGAAVLALLAADSHRDRWSARLPDGRWEGLREVGPHLGEPDVELAMTAQALGRWHATHRYCPRCGQPTWPAHGGWMRRCAADGSEHYPRTDPAVIMAVVDQADHLLLARAPAWPEDRRSVLAGFVEPGERLEAAVAREVREEVGVRVTGIRYLDSQPWPFPASIMLGYTAHVVGDARLTPSPAEIAEARWYSRDEVSSAVHSGRLLIPGRLSIARRLIERWFGAPLRPPVESTFGRR